MIIVNFSTDKYREGQQRLQNSLYKAGHTNYAMYGNYKQIGSPTHQQSPYEFKVHAIKKAAKQDPIVLWCDASMWLTGDLKKVEDLILKDGHFMQESGHNVRNWCNVDTLKYFRLMLTTPYTMFVAGCFGLDLRTERAQQFMKEWEASAKAGCFKGSWDNHRHDMTCGSIIASQLGMHYQDIDKYICYEGPDFPEPNHDCVFLCRGLV